MLYINNPYGLNEKEPAGYGKLIVNGRGSIKAVPDIINISLGVETTNVELQKALEENKLLFEGVMKVLKDMGIEDKDIKTNLFQVTQEYDYIDGKQSFRDYLVANNIIVTLRDINKAGELIDRAVKNGANKINGVEFASENTDKYEEEALSLALKNAIDKASSLAEGIGVQLAAAPDKIVEGGSIGVAPVSFAKGSLMVAQSISPGEIEIVKELSVQYSYWKF